MALTPMMQQYLQVKEKCKECILFFRLGDFYEMFFEDAEIASRELELVLTGRDCGMEQRAPMCGIPFHAANSYVGRLVSKGYKIAICEQLEDPSLAKGIVKRDIIKIITPGTYTDPNFLEEGKNNYVMSLFVDTENNQAGISFADISTGEFNCTEFNLSISQIIDEISRFNPTEIIIQSNIDSKLLSSLMDRFDLLYTKFDNDYFSDDAEKKLVKQFININIDGYSKALINSCSGLLSYIIDTQKIELSNINKLDYYSVVDYMSIDINSKRNLELTETLRDKSKKGSLLWVIDRTNTAMGARQLRSWIEKPLIDKVKIEDRLSAVEELLTNISPHEDLKELLKRIYDIERLVGKISSKNVNAKELISLKNSIEKLPEIKMLIAQFESNELKNIHDNLDELSDIYNILDKALLDNPSMPIKEGNIIKDGFNVEVDELRSAKTHGKEWIASLENSEREQTGIKSLKISYNKVFGYYIEITKSNLSSVPEGRYIRKQTLANAERYITPELKEMEDKILGAEESLVNLEYELFINIRDSIEKHINRMKIAAKLVSELDCLSSLATVALENNYCRPKINAEGTINIISGTHPVIEKMLSTGAFVENDTFINTKEDQLLLITGPNMAGKSTFMRQVALITLLSQVGSFVPAKSADISICDKIFTRIGASDDLSSGKSTFMVEMWEVSNILENATNKSLILLDEVGRGTSTYDGLSIAWSVIEYICKNPKLRCKTLFATHYHELTKLEGTIKGVKNYSVAVKEIGNEIVFLRKIISGGADQSYGIEVAKLAGLPEALIKRAKEILESLEQNQTQDGNLTINEDVKFKEAAVSSNDAIKQLGFIDIEKDGFLKEIISLDILNMTPIDSMNALYEIIKKAKGLVN